jgi:hypothetical protein
MTLRRTALRIAALAALAVAGFAPGAISSAATLYVGDEPEYAVAFKVEAGLPYVLEVAGTAHCYLTEPYKGVGGSDFSVFSIPRPMRATPDGFAAADSGERFGRYSAQIKAAFSEEAATGTLTYDESEESFHCETARSGVPFEARRFGPIGSAGLVAPAADERSVYYGSSGSIEAFLRPSGEMVGGIRGSFVPECRIGRQAPSATPRPLFGTPVFAAEDQDGRFRHRVEYPGRTRSGGRFRETATLSGRVKNAAITGTYLRERISKSGEGPPHRCTTGPLSFSAVRYLPVAASEGPGRG